MDAVSPVTLKVVPDGVPMETPPRKTSYPVTPTASVEAVHDKVKLVDAMLDAARPAGVEGACVSPAVPVTVRQKSSTRSVPAVPDFHVQRATRAVPAGATVVDEYSVYAAAVTVSTASLISLPAASR